MNSSVVREKKKMTQPIGILCRKENTFYISRHTNWLTSCILVPEESVRVTFAVDWKKRETRKRKTTINNDKYRRLLGAGITPGSCRRGSVLRKRNTAGGRCFPDKNNGLANNFALVAEWCHCAALSNELSATEEAFSDGGFSRIRHEYNVHRWKCVSGCWIGGETRIGRILCAHARRRIRNNNVDPKERPETKGHSKNEGEPLLALDRLSPSPCAAIPNGESFQQIQQKVFRFELLFRLSNPESSFLFFCRGCWYGIQYGW